MMPRMQVSVREALETENRKLYKRLEELEAFKKKVVEEIRQNPTGASIELQAIINQSTYSPEKDSD